MMTAELDTRIINLHDKGRRPHEIGKAVRISAHEVRIRLRMNGVDVDDPVLRSDAIMWESYGEKRLRAAAIAQDEAFKAAIRAAHFREPEPEPKHGVAIFLAPIEEVAPTPINFLSFPSWRFIVRYVALKHGLDDKEILGPSRVAKIARARQEAMALVKSHTRNTSLPAVGRLFGRDHTTVLHSIRSYEARRVA